MGVCIYICISVYVNLTSHSLRREDMNQGRSCCGAVLVGLQQGNVNMLVENPFRSGFFGFSFYLRFLCVCVCVFFCQ